MDDSSTQMLGISIIQFNSRKEFIVPQSNMSLTFTGDSAHQRHRMILGLSQILRSTLHHIAKRIIQTRKGCYDRIADLKSTRLDLEDAIKASSLSLRGKVPKAMVD
jgi:hypothetical protein